MRSTPHFFYRVFQRAKHIRYTHLHARAHNGEFAYTAQTQQQHRQNYTTTNGLKHRITSHKIHEKRFAQIRREKTYFFLRK